MAGSIKVKCEKVKLNSAGIRKLLLSKEVQDRLYDESYKIGEPVARYGGINRCKVLVKSPVEKLEAMGIETREGKTEETT